MFVKEMSRNKKPKAPKTVSKTMAHHHLHSLARLNASSSTLKREKKSSISEYKNTLIK